MPNYEKKMNLTIEGITEFTSEHVAKNSHELEFEGKILVLPMNTFHKDYQKPQYQLVRAFGGFGCSPHTLGRAVMVEFLEDGEKCRYNRSDILGVLNVDLVEKLNLK